MKYRINNRILLWILLSINIFVFTSTILLRDKKRESDLSQTSESKSSFNDTNEFYNNSCPDLRLTDTAGNSFELGSFVGDVILMKFTRFYKSDLAELLYLDNLALSLRKAGVHLFFISLYGKVDRASIDELCILESPIIEDSGPIMARFNNAPNDLIIIDRSHKIKYKYPIFNKSLVYKETMRWTYGRDIPKRESEQRSLFDALGKAKFRRIGKENQVEQFSWPSHSKRFILTLISTCLVCEQNTRIKIFKELIGLIQIDPNREFLLLFGKGNKPEGIRQYALIAGLDDPRIILGIIEPFEDDSLYYKLFDPSIDPKMVIMDRDKLSFVEKESNTNLVRIDYLMKFR